MAQKYKLIYCARINDDKHSGMLKVGDTEFTPTKPIHTYSPNEDALKKEAEARIRDWSGTAAVGAELVYCEALIRYNTKTENYETYRDGEVHTVLQHSGFPKVDFDSALDSGLEWFTVDLNTVKAAIKATKEYRDYLDTSELPEQDIYDLREEQEKAVKDTITRFKKKDDMLWHAKMRFGKTITALNLVKREAFKRTIIITHRPVVEDSWGSDFYHVFSNEDKYAFLTKIQNAEYVLNDDETDESIDKANDARLAQLLAEDRNFVYFASIQDLRGSKRVGGNFDKNNIVFDIDWDLVIIDEAHEGTKTELGQKVINLLIKDTTKKLDLSGTAYNLFDKYTEEGSVYTWDYVMEQEAKRKWTEDHPGEKNPYEDMPVMHINTFDLEKAIREHGLDLSGKSFSFREFFRTWTGDLSKDGQSLPAGSEIGDFVHPEAVRRFLDLLSQGDESSKFPYVTKDTCNQNRHSLWMVPGVKEAAALSKMLKKHPLFGQEAAFGIANVAGEGDHDEEKNYHNALEHVRKTIANHPNSITLSCGRLTTGVTVKEWTSVFMLSGSETTDAKNYMQTIFRVQSAGKIDGVQKKDAYVYDFAPDRTLLVIAATVLGSKRKGRSGAVIDDDDRHKAFSDFLEFCPVVAIDGAEFKPFGVESLINQINRVQIDRALKTGFTDNGIYDMSKFKSLNADDIDKMNAIFSKLKETKGKKPLSKAGMAKNNTSGTKTTGGTNSTGGKKTPEDDKEQKLREKEILEKLRTISIRIPLLFFGGNFEIEEGRLSEIITGIDQTSWEVFMPEKLTKDDFRELVRYYNQETVIGAGRIIRNDARKADKLSPTERVKAITDIFSHFHNPSKETVLTPWRVVNMHLSDTLGGWCFYNENFEENTDEYYKRLSEPRFVDQGTPTAQTFGNPKATILEINSKTGLYPLYAVYSIYRAKLGDRKESEMLPEDLLAVWDEAVKQVYVLCQSSMAADITKRTLIGYRNAETNIKYDEKLLNNLKNSIDGTCKKIKKGSYWDKEVKEMKFDAVVGNPPYQDSTSVNNRDSAVYPYFYDAAENIAPKYSLISPARFLFNTGLTSKEWNRKMLSNPHFKVVRFEQDATNIFPNTEIKGGVAITFFNKDEDFGAIDEFIPDEEIRSIASHFENNPEVNLSSIVFSGRSDLKFTEKFISKYPQSIRDRIVAIQKTHPDVKALSPNEEYELKSSTFEVLPYIFKDNEPENPSEYYKILGLVASKRCYKWIEKEYMVPRYETNNIGAFKVLLPESNGAGKFGETLSTPLVVGPDVSSTPTFIGVGNFSTLQEAENLLKYLSTKFARALLGILKKTHHNPSSVWGYIPLQDFTTTSDIIWDQSVEDIDKQLYTKYNFSSNEIDFIEANVFPMNISISNADD